MRPQRGAYSLSASVTSTDATKDRQERHGRTHAPTGVGDDLERTDVTPITVLRSRSFDHSGEGVRCSFTFDGQEKGQLPTGPMAGAAIVTALTARRRGSNGRLR